MKNKKVKILDGKKLADEILEDLKLKFSEVKKIKKRNAKLYMLVTSNDDATKSYIKSKEKACKYLGIESKTIIYDNIIEQDLIKEIEILNNDKTVDAILVQFPLAKNINGLKIMEKINPIKDVDGLGPVNMGKLVLGMDTFISCTAKAVITILEKYNINISGANVVIIGRSNIVGKPLANLFINKHATVEICNSKTKKLEEKINKADILISAVGKRNLILEKFLKDDAVILDVGITRYEDKLYGDVEFEEVIKKDRVSYISKVPGGVGPMTVASLMENILLAYLIDK